MAYVFDRCDVASRSKILFILLDAVSGFLVINMSSWKNLGDSCVGGGFENVMLVTCRDLVLPRAPLISNTRPIFVRRQALGYRPNKTVRGH